MEKTRFSHFRHVLVAAATTMVLSGCSLVSVSLPPSLFGIDEPTQTAQYPGQPPQEKKSWFSSLIPSRPQDPAMTNRRRPVYNPADHDSHMSAPAYSQRGATPYALNTPPMGGMGDGMTGFSSFYDQMPGGSPASAYPYGGNPYGQSNSGGYAPTGQAAPPPSYGSSYGNGMGGFDAPSLDGYQVPPMPSGPSDAQVQQGLQSLGWGKNSSGSYNPWAKYKQDPVFEPMNAHYAISVSNNDPTDTFNLALEDSYRRLTTVPEARTSIKEMQEKRESFEALEKQRDDANAYNTQIRSPENPSETLADELVNEEEMLPPLDTTDTAPPSPSFLERLQQLITIDADEGSAYNDNPHRDIAPPTANSGEQETSLFAPLFEADSKPNQFQETTADAPSLSAPPSVQPYRKPEGVILKPSRYKERRDRM